ncbi:MAG TPA: translation elongation factor Ts [Polyangia bacterium]|nr:translation elongation factor Ts [Polyangia bacterium]
MAEITATMIKELRERTGAGMSDCKKALTETDANLEQAAEYLRKKGLAAAAKKAGRIATEGAITSYIHNGRVGVLIEVNCETDFVAKTDDFQRFIKDVSMHIAGASPAPLVVSEADMDPVAVEKEREIRMEAARNPKQIPGEKLKVIPEAMIPKVVDGQIAKWKKDVCLSDQIWVRDPEGKKTIGALLNELVAKLGENIKIRRFVRWELGEGLEKKKDDFAAEVAKQAGL